MKKTEKTTENNHDAATDIVAQDTAVEAPENDDHSSVESAAVTESSAPQPNMTAETHPSPPKQGATWPGKLALVISIIALGGSGYLYWQGMQQRQSDTNAIGTLHKEVESTLASAKSQIADAKAVVNAQVNSVNQNLTMLQNQSTKEQKNIEELQQRLTASIQQVMAAQGSSRQEWLFAEVEYLLRLANQRILMENTSTGALALLKSADKILKETDDVSIYAVRKQLAADIAALEAVPTFDLEGSYLKLAALDDLVDNLRLIPITDKNKLPSLIEEITPESVSESWTQGLKASWAKAVDKLEKLVVIQHRDEKVEPLLSPEQTFYLQQNLHLMLEQTQLSLLQKEQAAFTRGLEKSEQWIATYFEEKDATTQALLRGIGELKTLHISPQLPNISGSLNALKAYLKQMAKLKAEGAE